MKRITILLLVFLLVQIPANGKIGNTLSENSKLYGNELSSRDFSDDKKNFSGKKVYQFPYFGWQIESIYKNGKSFSETIRPKGGKVARKTITEQEASTIAASVYPREQRGMYRKQVKNAHFISHFYENGVVSLEMLLDKSRKNHVGVIGVRCILYSDGANFNSIMVGAYH